MKIYISGAISGMDFRDVVKYFNAMQLRLYGLSVKISVLSPLHNGVPHDAPWVHHMEADIKMMLKCSAICIIGDISKSRGAQLELHIAKELGYKVISDSMSDDEIKQILGV